MINYKIGDKIRFKHHEEIIEGIIKDVKGAMLLVKYSHTPLISNNIWIIKDLICNMACPNYLILEDNE